MLRRAVLPSPIGPLTLVASDDALVAIDFPDRGDGRAALPEAPRRHAVIALAERELAAYFAGTGAAFTVPLAPEGTAFQQACWRALRAIPYAETRTYGEQAALVGKPSAARAVGAANGANPIPIVVPCHRVIGASGALVGFGGGLPTKRWLLAHEAKHGARQATLGL